MFCHVDFGSSNNFNTPSMIDKFKVKVHKTKGVIVEIANGSIKKNKKMVWEN